MTAPKYTHPHNGKTWTGRGKNPAWVQEWLDAGNTLAELEHPERQPATEAAPPTVVEVLHLPPEHLHPSPTNPRKTFPAEALADLAASIRAHGILQPILVRPWPVYGEAGAAYEIIAGERRWRAAVLAQQASVPVLVRHLSDQETVEFQVVENLQREDLHPLEEAEGYDLMMRDFGYSADHLAAKIGKSKAYVYARVKLATLGEVAREAFRAGLLTPSTALLAARIPVSALQTKYVQDISQGYGRPLSYRDAARLAQTHYATQMRDAAFDLSADLVPSAGPCTTCPHRSINTPELYADAPDADVCTDPDCYAAKRDAHAAQQRAAAEADGRKIITGPEAEKIIPAWATRPMAQPGSGFIALDETCYSAPRPPNEAPPPVEPEEDADEATIAAYDAAVDAWETSTTPTYRDLLAGTGGVVETVLVQHPATGEMVECVQAQAAAPILAARGVNVHTGRTTDDSERERAKVASAQTAYRTRLVECILFAAREEDVDLTELRLIAAEFYALRDFETQKKIVRIWRKNPAARIEREHTHQLAEDIQHMHRKSLHSLLRLITLAGRIHVAAYHSVLTTLPPALVAMADRWGIDLVAVQHQAAKTKGK